MRQLQLSGALSIKEYDTVRQSINLSDINDILEFILVHPEKI